MQRMTRRQLVRAGLVSTGALALGGVGGHRLPRFWVPPTALAACVTPPDNTPVPTGTQTYDSFTVMALSVLKGFRDWCASNSVAGAITESGIPEQDGAVYEPACNDWAAYNTAYSTFLSEIDQGGLPFTAWAAGRGWGNDPLAIYSDDGASTYIDTVRSSATPLEAHQGALKGVNLSGAEYPGPNNGDSTMAISAGYYSNGNPGVPDSFDGAGNYANGDYFYPIGPNAYPTQPAPTQNDWAFIYNRGVRLVRLQLAGWERLQPTLGAALNAAELTRLQHSLADAAAAVGTCGDLKLILDLHGYCRYTVVPPGGTTATEPTEANGGVCVMRTVSTATRVDPQTGLAPNSPGMLTAANLADFWSRMATWVGGLPANLKSLVYALSLMNEPHDLYPETAPVARSDAQVWEYCSQQAVSAIRAAGWTGQVYVGGYNWQSAGNWASTHGAPWIPTTQNPLTYDAHLYLDPVDGSGLSYQGYSADNATAAGTNNSMGVAYGTTWTW